MRAVFLLLLCCFIINVNGADEVSYIGAVVEFSPVTSPRPENLNSNVERFREFIKQAKQEGADIIVFPEIGLNGYGTDTEEMLTEVPDPSQNVIPCDSKYAGYYNALKALSCQARDSSIYVVANVAERYPCTTCQEKNATLRYNTNVAFDRKGTVIARYRKYHLFGEAGKNTTLEPEVVFFDTDFGVRFGTFICFDLMFDQPTLQLAYQLGIRDYVFSTAWFSELPFLTALQAQHAWSYSLDVNFLGSGYNFPLVGSGGSGIYLGRNGFINATMKDVQSSSLLTGKVFKKTINRSEKVLWNPSPRPKRENVERFDKGAKDDSYGMYLKHEEMSLFGSRLLTEEESDFELCYGEFCCNFKVSRKPFQSGDSSFRAIVFDGVRTFDGVATGGVQYCAIISCANSNYSSCPARINSDAVWKSIEITGKFLLEDSLVMPNTLINTADGLRPFNDFKFISASNGSSISHESTNELQNLLTFGLYSRVFSRDGLPASGQI